MPALDYQSLFNDTVTLGSFVVLSLTVYLVGTLFARARQRAQKLSDLSLYSLRKPAWFQQAMAGALPQLGSEQETLDKDLKRAGYYGPFALVEYLATRNTLVVTSVILFGLLAVCSPPGSGLAEEFLIAGLVTSGLGYGIPRFLLSLQARSRLARIQKGLPDGLDIVRMCVAGGLTLREALERVAVEIEAVHPDIAVEFDVIRRQSEADTMKTALKKFSERVDTPDVKALAALISQADRLGTNIAQAVTEYADSVRRAARQRAEENASKTSIKLLFPVILCLSPPVFILLLGPPLLNLTTFVKESRQPGGVLDPTPYQEQLGPQSGNRLPPQ